MIRTTITYNLLLRYGIVGVCGAFIQISTLYIWVDVLRMEDLYLLGAAIGFCVALAITFTLQKYWTFRDHAHTELRKQFIWYTSFALISLVLNIVLLHVSKTFFEYMHLHFFDTWYLVAQLFIVGFVALLAFMANYFVTFNRDHSMDTDM